MRALILASILVATPAAMAACGGGSASEPHVVTDEEFMTAAQAAADAALITLSDLPAGWSGTPPDDSDDDWIADAQPSPECAILSEEAEFPGAVHETESYEFDIDEDEDVSVAVGVYRSVEAAGLGQGAFDLVFTTCRDEFVRIFEEQAALETPGYGWDLALDGFDAEQHGDWTQGMVMTLTVTPPDGAPPTMWTWRSLAIREGRVMGALSWGETDAIDDALVETLTDLLAERLAEAEASLPG